MAKAKKSAPKAKISNTNKKSNSNDEVVNLIRIIIIVTVVFLIFYVITIVATKEKKTEPTPSTIQYDEILIGNILKQSNDEYYVLIYEEEDLNVATYNIYLSTYKSSEGSLRYYTANLNNPFNDKFISENDEVFINSEDINQLRVTSTTLLRIKKGKIEDVYYLEEEIRNHLISIQPKEED